MSKHTQYLALSKYRAFDLYLMCAFQATRIKFEVIFKRKIELLIYDVKLQQLIIQVNINIINTILTVKYFR